MSSDKLNMPKNFGLLKAKKQEKTLKLLLKQLDIKLENNIYCCCGRTEYLSKSREFHKCSKLSNSSKLILKVGLLPSKKVFFICFNDSPSKMMKNAFYFIVKSLFILKIFKFLS